MKNSLGIDFEQWFDRPVLRPYIGGAEPRPSDILPATREILRVLREYRKTTTFFVLGQVALDAPEAIEQIVKEGHEVGCHGLVHRRLQELGERRFEDDLQKACDAIRHVAGEAPRGFRAPQATLGRSTAWAVPVLERNGFRYDSSVIPMARSGAPRHPYFPSREDPTKEDPGARSACLELPLLTYDVGLGRVPAAGGFYFRLLGTSLMSEAVRQANRRGRPAVCYFHPWELSGFPQLKMPAARHMFAYYNIPCLRQFERFIRNVDVAPARDLVPSGS